MVASSGVKLKSEIILEVIIGLVLVICFVTVGQSTL